MLASQISDDRHPGPFTAAAVGALGACGSNTDHGSMPGMGSSSPAASATSSAAMTEVMFAQMMIPQAGDSSSARSGVDTPPRGGASFALPTGAGHVHAVAKDPSSGRLLLATHARLFRQGAESFERVGPVLDLMGFTVAGANHYYASGHPGPGSDLPQPVGLIQTVDGGRTWGVLSRGGVSDFHAMTVTGSGVSGFDGALRHSSDGAVWAEAELGVEVISLAGRAGDRRVVASSADAVRTSSDAGWTWAPVAGSPAPALVSRADNTVIAVTADGRIHLADASGRAWKETELRAPAPLALLATGSTAQLEIVVLAEDGLFVSRSGRAFVPWTPAG